MDLGNNDPKKLPFNSRKQIAIEKIRTMLNDLDVDIAPILVTTANAMTASLIYVDMQNEEMLKQLGLEKAPNANVQETSEKLSN